MVSIKVDKLKKVYKYYEKEAGLKSSFQNLFGRKTLYKEAVKEISFTIEEGETVGFIGPNGAGKTTTLKMLSGILYPSGGTASVLGHTPWERKNEFKRQFSLVMGQKNQLWWDLPAIESLDLNRCIYQIDQKDYQKSVEELSELLNVKHLLNVQVRRLSLGERMKMELVAALLHKPKIVLLDEPTIGLDIVSQRNLRDFIKYYNRQFQSTVLLTSHYLQDIEDLCKRVIIINNGTITYDGELLKVNEIFNQVKIVKLYFGKPVEDSVLASYGKIRESDGYHVVMDVNKDDLSQVARSILDQLNPLDFSIEDVPLEEGISFLYGQTGGGAHELVR